jgi:hypothetical protein
MTDKKHRPLAKLVNLILEMSVPDTAREWITANTLTGCLWKK